MLTKTTKSTDKTNLEMADIINVGLERYRAKYGNLPWKKWKVINNILSCRTESLGGHLYECDSCGHKTISYNSCRDRHCPKCQSIARALWVEKRTSELLPVGYFHVVFTIPDSFNGYNIEHKRTLYNILYRSASETLLTLGKDPRWLGGDIGFLAVLHTWGQQLLEHPHLHCILPGGGIRLDGKKWVCFRDNYLIPENVMAQVFRGTFISYFKNAVERSEISYPAGVKNEQKFKSFLNDQWKKDWVVYAKEPFGSTEQVVKYLGRYTHRIAFSNKRIVAIHDGRVSFTWKDYKDNNKQKILDIEAEEFLKRYFLHVLPEGFVRIRYYGLLSNGNKTKKLKKCFELLNLKYEKNKDISSDVITIMKLLFKIDLTLCQKCQVGHFKHRKKILKKPSSRFREAA